jgi:putative addiction module killer protein
LDTLGYVFVILRSAEFDAWLSALADAKGKARILARLRSAAFGNFGDCEVVGEGVSEMRLHVGPGYRVYFARTERTVYLLLTGGDKSTQSKDIARAKLMARAIRENKR